MAHNRRTVGLLVGSIAAIALVTTSCSNSGSGNGGASSPATSSEATSAGSASESPTAAGTSTTANANQSSGSVSATGSSGGADANITGTVRWTMLNYDDGVKAWTDSIVAGFEKKYPGVKVEVTLPPTNQYQDLITTEVQGGSPPDIAAMATAWVPALADAGALDDWSTYLDKDFLSTFDQNLLNGAKYQGQQVSLPYLSTSRALFYNKAAFQKAGLTEPPKTWEDVVADGAKIQQAGGAKFGFALQGKGVEAFAAWFPYFYWAYGGEFTGDAKTVGIDAATCEKALAPLYDMTNKSKITQPDPTSADAPDQIKLFTSGQAAMTISGPWVIGSIKTDNPNLDYGVAQIPNDTGGSATLGVQDAYVLFKGAKNPDAAVALLKYIMEPENADTFVDGRGMLPVLTAGFDAERYQSDPLKTFVSMLPSAKFAPQTAAWTGLSDAGTKALQNMYVNGASPQETCQAIVKGASGGGL